MRFNDDDDDTLYHDDDDVNDDDNMNIEIDAGSGFCFGVTTAISKAEEELTRHNHLYCLGDIVHNERECDRLREMGLEMIDHDTFSTLRDTKVLLRAHGEPPTTYHQAEERGITIIDATCPVVLNLQRRIKKVYQEYPDAQIVIYGKPGHAEVLGLVGQTNGTAIVIADISEVGRIDMTRTTFLFSQTTKSLEGFRQVVEYMTQHIMAPAEFHYFDTICRRVSNRLEGVREFAKSHDVILFVSGQKSSNGRVLCEACRSVNPHTYLIDDPDALNTEWIKGAKSIGICGATSTPKWLMERCAEKIKTMSI